MAADSIGVAIFNIQEILALSDSAMKIVVEYYETAFDLVVTNDKQYL